MIRYFIFVFVLSLSFPSYAKNFTCRLQGKVISVADGDTVTVLDSKKRQYKVRLAGIDAPERGQPYGKKSKKYLSALVYKKTVCVDWYKRDKYRRLIGRIFVGNTDVNFKIVNKWLAWHYKKYQKEQSRTDRKKYSNAEIDAKLAVIGLWSEPDAIAPWKWRKVHVQREFLKNKSMELLLKREKPNPERLTILVVENDSANIWNHVPKHTFI